MAFAELGSYVAGASGCQARRRRPATRKIGQVIGQVIKLVGALLGAVGLVAACGGGFRNNLSEAETQEYMSAWAEDGRLDGARVRESIPLCTDTEVPEDALRLEGTLMPVTQIWTCTDSSCFAPALCCDACELDPYVIPRSGFKPAARIIVEGNMRKLFRGPSRPDCQIGAWWKAMGAPLVRITWMPDPEARTQPRTKGHVDARHVLELCRVDGAL